MTAERTDFDNGSVMYKFTNSDESKDPGDGCIRFAIKERPILFSSPMICSILDGRKTQTRRIIKGIGVVPGIGEVLKGSDDAAEWPDYCPFGKVGDQLWVRETWGDCTKGSDIMTGTHWDKPLYKADADAYGLLGHDGLGPIYAEEIRWRPSIHMPRWASRILLEITDVRVERLNDISEEDAIAEGIQTIGYTGPGAGPNNYTICIDSVWLNSQTAAGAYAMLWESINGQGSWDLNPFVWCISFKVISK